MSFFQDAKNVTVTGGTQVAAAAGSIVTINHWGSSAFKDLSASAAHTALYNSSARFDAPRCHRNTRTLYLDALERWMLGHGDEYAGARLIWLTGGAGAGKSAIMQSIVERCAKQTLILGTFFFFRTDPSRNYAEVLIPTLAYQLARTFPAAMAIIEPAVQRDPLIFKASLQTQAYDLLVRPFLYLIETGVIDITSPLRRVFVIDGLDECDDPKKQALIIHAVADILSDNLGPICVLIASRPEVAISRAFQRENSLHSILSTITLDDNDEASSDIRQYIEDSFLDILDTHCELTSHSIGPALTLLMNFSFSELGNTVTMVCFMYPHISPEDVTLFLSDIQALVSLSPDKVAEMEIILKHASLGDFLMGAKRSQAIHMSKEEHIAFCLPRYFWLLDNWTSPQVWRSLRRFGYMLTSELSDAIFHSHHIELVQSLICRHTPQDVWNFCVEYFKHDAISSSSVRELAIQGVSLYVRAIRDSAADHDNALYIHQFKMLVQLLLDDIHKLVQSEPQYRFIRALMFSSSLSRMIVLADLLLYHFLTPQFHVSHGYSLYFRCLQREGLPNSAIDPRSFDAIKRLPQSQCSWGSDFSIGLAPILRHLVGYSWTPECLYPNPHERWLHKIKPLKHISHGFPKLSSTIDSYLRRLPTPQVRYSLSRLAPLKRCGYSRDRARKIWDTRAQCFTLLKAVICYLHKCDCTSELAKLARKSLPKAALWFPRLMKRARAEMDAYGLRWEESPEGLLEKAQSLSINDID
ncbi:hypothetical protein D9619_004937 [Psilocybe cf. subviscida]|uniref:Nephrocystin 3-like N-terminal domain-containing protein n=1 Tax=Psilocybe cf. subviscida TaxID=2480587 RepID=A0A8H5BR34_9AGAR|nr:hypothetical protein D9619_004937 [Psilocybe cf. subviscida]